MTLFDVFLILAIITLSALLFFILFLIIVIFKTYKNLQQLERSLHGKIDLLEQHFMSKKGFVLGAFPFVTTLAPLLLSVLKKVRSKR